MFVFLIFTLFQLSVIAGRDMKKYYKRTGDKYIEDMCNSEKIIKLKSGLCIELLKNTTRSTARSPRPQDKCIIKFTGRLRNGTIIDSEEKTTVVPNSLIHGLYEPLQFMGEGDIWRVYVPEYLAYGEKGKPPSIPPFNPLIFELELIKVIEGIRWKKEARHDLFWNIERGDVEIDPRTVSPRDYEF